MSGTKDTYTTSLSAYLSSADSISETVQRLTHPIANQYQKQASSAGANDLNLEALWTSILRAASTAPPAPTPNEPSPHHTKLLAVVKAIAALGPLTRDSDSAQATHDNGVVWTDLPAFGHAARTKWNEAPGSGAQSLSADAWTNVNAFAALVTADQELGASKPSCDLSLFALWSLRSALEQDLPATSRDKSSGSSATASLDDVLPAAVAWLENAGEVLAQLCQKGKSYVPAGRDGPDPAWVGALGKDKISVGGFSSERWTFWRSRLIEISQARDDAGGREKVAKVAHHGVEKMDAV